MPRQQSTRAAKDGGFKLPSATKKTYKPPKKDKAYCGARKRNGGNCTMQAGWGTNHPGIGRCKMHAGSTPTGVKSAAKQAAMLLGQPKEINPLDALIWCIKIKAGEVEWLSDEMAKLDEKHWVEDTMVGKQFHIYARMRQQSMNELARFSQMAISLGIAERAVKMAEMYGEMLATLLHNVLTDLQLSKEQQERAPIIIRRHLIALDGGRQDAVAEGMKQLPAAEAAAS